MIHAKRKWMGSAAVALALLGAASTASAWTKFKNSTANTVWLAYAYQSVSGVACGYSTCGGGWRVQGWWQIAPGGTVTVNGHDHHNAKHHFYAQDQFGHIWNGTGTQQRLETGAFDYCNGIINPGDWIEKFQIVRNTTCCGFWCDPVNYTANLVL